MSSSPARLGRHARLAVAFLATLFLVPAASAEPVTHQFTGTVTYRTTGGPTTLDLTSVFPLGTAATLYCTIERSTPPSSEDAYTATYTDAVTHLSFSIDTWGGSGTPPSTTTTVTNDQPSPLKGPQTLAAYDQYSAQVSGLSAPPLGDIQLVSLTYTFDDVQGTVFDSTVLPRVFPDMSAWEGKTLTILVISNTQFKTGYLMATLDNVSTPALPTSWGAIKGMYRN
jgi:hypothetical protein